MVTCLTNYNLVNMVYSCSARERECSPSLNDCLSPPLQNKLWNVLVRGRFHPVALAGDVRKIFLQVHIAKGDRDALHFHWLRSINSNVVETKGTQQSATCLCFM